jgi:hypothetical protein
MYIRGIILFTQGGIRAFRTEYNVKRSIIVCTENLPRILDEIEILPWELFLERLWRNEII